MEAVLVGVWEEEGCSLKEMYGSSSDFSQWAKERSLRESISSTMPRGLSLCWMYFMLRLVHTIEMVLMSMRAAAAECDFFRELRR